MNSGPGGSLRLSARRLAVLVCLAATLAGVPDVTALATDHIAARRDLVYRSTAGGDLALDVYRPRGRSNLPVLLVVHGGSWRRGDKSDVADRARTFARAGFLALAPNYRLAPPGGTTTFPAPLRDLRAALGWARRNAARFGGDPHRVAVAGTSAGAHLSLLLAGTGRLRPGAVALYSPPVDLRSMHDAGVATEAIEALLGCAPNDCPDTYTRASGLFQVDPRTSPVSLVYSSNEVLPVDQGRRLNRRLAELGIRHRTHEIEGTAHGFSAGRGVFDETVRFLKRSLNSSV